MKVALTIIFTHFEELVTNEANIYNGHVKVPPER